MADPLDDPLGLAKQSPATTGSAQVDPVTAAINAAARDYLEAQQTTGFRRFFGGASRADAASDTLKTLMPLQKEARAGETARMQAEAEQRKADAQKMAELRNFITLFREDTKDYFGQGEDVQKAIRPGRVKVWKMAGKALGLDDEDIEGGFSIPEFVDKAMAIADPIVQNSPDLAAYSREMWGSAKTREDKLAVAADIDKRARQTADNMIRAGVPRVLQRMGRGPLNPATPEEIKKAVLAVAGGYKDSPVLLEQFDAFMTDPKNEVALQQLGVKTGVVEAAANKARAVKEAEKLAETSPEVVAGEATKAGEVEKAKRLAQGPKVDVDTETILSGQGLTPATARPAEIEAARKVALAEKEESRVRVAAATGREAAALAKLGEEDKKALRAYDSILAATKELRSFKPDEVQSYAGFWRRGLRDIKQIAGSVPGLGALSDDRYAHFRALTGRLGGTAFAEGGKQLTPFEAEVVFTYTPTGKELGGSTEFMAKVDQLERYTKIRRQLVVHYAQRGLDPREVPDDVWDVEMKTKMKAAGLPVESKDTGKSPAAGGWKIERVQ